MALTLPRFPKLATETLRQRRDRFVIVGLLGMVLLISVLIRTGINPWLLGVLVLLVLYYWVSIGLYTLELRRRKA